MPFALNESTRYISPTKTPEFLAAGIPVVSTAIKDVVNPYGDKGLVEIARDAKEIVSKIDLILSRAKARGLLVSIGTWPQARGTRRGPPWTNLMANATGNSLVQWRKGSAPSLRHNGGGVGRCTIG